MKQDVYHPEHNEAFKECEDVVLHIVNRLSKKGMGLHAQSELISLYVVAGLLQ